jgi:hypothetical protein
MGERSIGMFGYSWQLICYVLLFIIKTFPHSRTKTGVVGLMRSGVQELGPFNVNRNAVCLGHADTKTAALVACLALDKARYISGQTVKLDGGLMISSAMVSASRRRVYGLILRGFVRRNLSVSSRLATVAGQS